MLDRKRWNAAASRFAPHAPWGVPAFASLVSLAVYLLTLLKEPSWGDSAELALQAFQLGVTHPPGYPVHSLLGKLFSLPFAEPAVGTGLLGAVCASLAVGILASLVYGWSRSIPSALLAAGLLAFSPQIWEYAVMTEIYNLNLACFAVSLWLAWQAARGGGWRWTAAAGIVFGISLGAYLANLLLIPGFWVMLGFPQGERRPEGSGVRKALLFTLLAGAVGGLALAWSVLRAAALPPLGTSDLPVTLAGAWRYFSGAQYGTMLIQPFSFYLKRAAEHASIFTFNWGGLGLLFGLAGMVFLLRGGKENRRFGLPLLLIFAIDMIYFTGYRAFDYHTMVTPAYFIFGVWVGCGAAGLARLAKRPLVRTGVYLLLAVTLIGVFALQAQPRWQRSRTTPVTQSALKILKEAPGGAMLAADWSKFTVLLYLQKTRALRPDLTVIERNSDLRYYPAGGVRFPEYLAQQVKERPVLVDGWDASLEPAYRSVQAFSGGWIQIEAVQPGK